MLKKQLALFLKSVGFGLAVIAFLSFKIAPPLHWVETVSLVALVIGFAMAFGGYALEPMQKRKAILKKENHAPSRNRS